MAVFFGMREWPGLWEASLRRPLTAMDEALWGRRNALWRAGIREQSPGGAFWRGGVDVQCDLAELGGQCPPLGIVAGWFDVFVRQALDDFQAAQAQVPGRAQLTVCGAGHLGLSMRYGQLVLHETLALYDECLRGMDRAVARSRLGLPDRRAVRLELVGAPAGQNWLECDAWPPEPAETMGWFVAGGSGHGQLALAEPPGEGSLEYVYDPGSPTPYEGGGWLNLRKEGQRDQSSLECRADVLVCSSPELEDSIDVVGEVRADTHLRLVLGRGVRFPGAPVRGASGVVAAVAAALALERSGGFTVHHGGAVQGPVWRLASGRRGGSQSGGGPGAHRVPLPARRAYPDTHLGICSAAHPRALRHPLSADDWLAGDGAVGPPARQRVHFGAGGEYRGMHSHFYFVKYRYLLFLEDWGEPLLKQCEHVELIVQSKV
ncbi:unnamed protein product [Prorocentrum cordatum]|uniref:Xaa-Pro dipeptidyl-peptidase C-terminal domain-containing protein n=1 Tax=Prorocentrum cordatum TaxID=2364126 RepID=A0ABN9UH65_9DINO|nr:unnamed protein product [Polarella glacialis]